MSRRRHATLEVASAGGGGGELADAHEVMSMHTKSVAALAAEEVVLAEVSGGFVASSSPRFTSSRLGGKWSGASVKG